MAGLLGSGARVGVAAWGRAGCWPRGVSAPATASPAAASMLGRPAPARCPMLGRCPSPGPNAGSVASSATWSARPAKVPGGNPLGTAIPGPRRVRRLLARAAALRRARAPGRREGRFVYRERKDFPLDVSRRSVVECGWTWTMCENQPGYLFPRTRFMDRQITGSGRLKHILLRTSWGSYRARNRKSKTAVTRGRQGAR